jgi:3-dehydroquinate dehydratase-2
VAKFLIIHGPNLNLLGIREPGHYGNDSLKAINNRLTEIAETAGHEIDCFQSNSESGILEKIHTLAQNPIDFIVINPAAFTHTSVALRDALSGVAIPFIEVHISNVFTREAFRHHSYFSDIAIGIISGLGVRGYEYALHEAIARITE